MESSLSTNFPDEHSLLDNILSQIPIEMLSQNQSIEGCLMVDSIKCSQYLDESEGEVNSWKAGGKDRPGAGEKVLRSPQKLHRVSIINNSSFNLWKFLGFNYVLLMFDLNFF